MPPWIPLCIALLISPVYGHAQDERSIQAIVTAHCQSCHTVGIMNAPRIGDEATWQALSANHGGVDGLLQKVIQGSNGMPPKGSCGSCSDDQLREAIKVISGL